MDLILKMDERKLIPQVFIPDNGSPPIAVLFAGDYPIKLDLFLIKNGERSFIASVEAQLP